MRVVLRVNLPSCAMQPKNDIAVGAHFGRGGPGHKMDPRSLVEQTPLGEEGKWRVRALMWGRWWLTRLARSRR